MKASSLPRQSAHLAALWAAQALLGFVAQPVLNTHLSATERGQMALCIVALALTFDLARPGVTPATIYRVASGEAFWPVVIVDVIWGVATIPLLLGMSLLLPWFTSGTFTPIPVEIAMIAILTPLMRVGAGSVAGFSGAGAFGLVAITGAGSALVLLVGRLALVPRWSLKGALYAEALAVLVVVLGPGLLAWRRFGWRLPQRVDFVDTWNYGRRAFGGQVGTLVMERGMPLVLYSTVGAALAGTYVAVTLVPQTILSITALVSRPLFTASARLDRGIARALVSQLSRAGFFGGFCSAMLVIGLHSTVLSLLRADRYGQSEHILILLCAQLPFRVSSALLAAYLSGAGQPALESRATLYGGLVGLVMAGVGGLLAGVSGALLGYLGGVVLQWWRLASSFQETHAGTRIELCLPRLGDFVLAWQYVKRRHP